MYLAASRTPAGSLKVADKSAYSLFRPVDIHSDTYTNGETSQATSPFPEDENGDPITQLRAYRANSHPLIALARARTTGDIAALAERFMRVNLGQMQPTARDVQLENLSKYRSLFQE